MEINEKNEIYIEAYVSGKNLQLTLESYITYCVYKFCASNITLIFVNKLAVSEKPVVSLDTNELNYTIVSDVPWQVDCCKYPVVWTKDTIITGLCAVARHICKFKTAPRSQQEHVEGLLGFRRSCLQAPNEVSIWTKFCEVELIGTCKTLLKSRKLHEVPKNLVRFENHLKKPVRIHNVYKIARELKKVNLSSTNDKEEVLKQNQAAEKSSKENAEALKQKQTGNNSKQRIPKSRKWKANKKTDIDISTKIEDLGIHHEFAEGPFFTLADLILFPSYYVIVQSIGETFGSLLPVTHKWYMNVKNISQLQDLLCIMNKLKIKPLLLEDVVVPKAEDVSLYKCDPKRHNPKKRMFTDDKDIENALSALSEGMEMEVSSNKLVITIDSNENSDGADPINKYLPQKRIELKSLQLQNLLLFVLKIAKDGDLIVDFCSGSGHLGILIARLLPKSTVILLENKEQSLMRARSRVYEMGLKNVFFFQCNLDFFIGKFDVGIALHACGIATDLVLDKCLKANAKFVICPCCYGFLHATDRLVYPRSNAFKTLSIEQYLCIGHAADQTHKEHPLTVRGARCMAVIDSDRGRLAEEFGYKVTLTRLKPLSCTPKNNLLIGIPS